MKRGPAPSAGGVPPAEVQIDVALVRSLLAEQHADLAMGRLRALDSGWDNAMFRLDDHLVIRLPRRAAAVALLQREQRWLGELAPRLPLTLPVPLRIGQPGCGYPWPWSVLPWLVGEAADLCPPEPGEAPAWADFLRALHTPAPADAPVSAVRGVPLGERAQAGEERMARLVAAGHFVDEFALRAVWHDALDAPSGHDRTWLHGDLHARNVLVDQGRISGVIDWGDLCSGDAATDLASVWMLLPTRRSREQAMASYGEVDSALWRRARGWALMLGVLLLGSGLVDHQRHAAMGALTLRRLVEGP